MTITYSQGAPIFLAGGRLVQGYNVMDYCRLCCKYYYYPNFTKKRPMPEKVLLVQSFSTFKSRIFLQIKLT